MEEVVPSFCHRFRSDIVETEFVHPLSVYQNRFVVKDDSVGVLQFTALKFHILVRDFFVLFSTILFVSLSFRRVLYIWYSNLRLHLTPQGIIQTNL